MANFRGQIIMNLLRLLTPEEISELTTTSCGAERIDLNNLLQFELDGNDYRDYKTEDLEADENDNNKIAHTAKIISIDKSTEIENENSIPLIISKEVKNILNSFLTECMELDKSPLGQKRKPKRKNKNHKKQMSTFILEEKSKMDQSYSKLKTVEILDLYQKNAAVDIDLQKNNNDDLSKSSQYGVLVNKKRA